MATIQVTFPKNVSGIHDRDRYELEQFDFEADDRQSGLKARASTWRSSAPTDAKTLRYRPCE